VDVTPHAKRRGWLRNGNPVGDYMTAPRCGARNRKGTPCRCPAMRNGRCRLHGGWSTGPKTAEGIERIRRARTKHGLRSQKWIQKRRTFRETMRRMDELIRALGADTRDLS
jgi:hypothetical protein